MFLSIAAKGKEACLLDRILNITPSKIFENEDLRAFFPVYDQEKQLADVVIFNPLSPDFSPGNFCRGLEHSFAHPNRNLCDGPALDLIIEVLPIVTFLSDEQLKGLWRPLGYEAISADAPSEKGYGQTSFFIDHSGRKPWEPMIGGRVLGLTTVTRKTVFEVMSHLLVLLPVMSINSPGADKSYLEEYGGTWLSKHPMQSYIRSLFVSGVSRTELDSKLSAASKMIFGLSIYRALSMGGHIELAQRWLDDTSKIKIA